MASRQRNQITEALAAKGYTLEYILWQPFPLTGGYGGNGVYGGWEVKIKNEIPRGDYSVNERKDWGDTDAHTIYGRNTESVLRVIGKLPIKRKPPATDYCQS